MSKEITKKAGDIINSKTDFVGGGMEGYAALSLIDENGYPSATTFAIVKADGINWITFATGIERPYIDRIHKNNKACVCINSSKYTINLVGTVEALTDIETKKANWLSVSGMEEHFSGPEDPGMLVIRFTTERYSIFFDDGSYVSESLKGTEKKAEPVVEPMIQFDGDCEEAIEVYQKAFGAKLIHFMRFSEADPQDWQSVEDTKDLVYHAQIMIGSQRILLCDNLFNDLPRGHSVYPVITFKTVDEVKAAYNILADGATIKTPLGKTTYSACIGSLVDKFGIHWDLMAQ
ncbi:MAG: VOC family protein [Defluviitaleaceae bacterium]|nr:VOC family protein [Defluviitaleaceae bacterium]